MILIDVGRYIYSIRGRPNLNWYGDVSIHQRLGRGRGYYRTVRDGDGTFATVSKISKEEFIKLGGTTHKTRGGEIGKKLVFAIGSISGSSLTLILSLLLL